MDVVMEEEGELRRSSQRQARRSGSRNNTNGADRNTGSAGSSTERGEKACHSHSRAQSNHG